MELGMMLRELRELSGLSQREFAERIGLDQSRVSRIESGSIVGTDDDIRKWLDSAPADDADRARAWLRAPWEALGDPPPRWNHPDVPALALAAEVVQRLNQDVPEDLRPSAEVYRVQLLESARQLRNLAYRVSVVGASAVGKSTAESYALDLRTPSGDLVLPTGGGNTTLCEMLIEQGERFGILVKPEPPDEVRRLVEDLCAVLQPKLDRPPEERPAIPTEVRTALLNMAGLGPRTETGPDGQTVRREPVRDLAQKEGERLVSSLLLRLRLAERCMTELWWDPGMTGEPLSWLRDNLKKINKGLHPEAPLPQQIRVVLGHPVFAESPFAVSVLDTRGITDDVVRRPDVAASLADERTVVVLCSSFLNSPDLYVRKLIQYAREQEFMTWQNRLVLVLLARESELLQVRYEDTDELVDTAEDAKRIKEAQTNQQLAEFSHGEITVATYNAWQDPPSRFRSLVGNRIAGMRTREKQRIDAIATAANAMLDGAKLRATQMARQAISRDVLLFLDGLENVELGAEQPQDALIREVGGAHARSVWAMTRRQGQWRTLSLDLLVSDAAAQLARTGTRDPLAKLVGVLDLLQKRPDLQEGHGLIQQLRETIEKVRADFAAQARFTAQATIWSPMHADLRLWADCEEEWIRGPGFRSRVVGRLRDWFERNHNYVADFLGRVETAWHDSVIDPLRQLCRPSTID